MSAYTLLYQEVLHTTLYSLNRLPKHWQRTQTQGHLRPSVFKTEPLAVSIALNYTLSFPTKQTCRCCSSALVVTPANKERGKATCHRKHASPWHHCITHPLQPKVCIHLRLETGLGGAGSENMQRMWAWINCKTKCRGEEASHLNRNIQDTLFPGLLRVIWQRWSCHSNWVSRMGWLTAVLCILHPVRMVKMHTSAG